MEKVNIPLAGTRATWLMENLDTDTFLPVYVLSRIVFLSMTSWEKGLEARRGVKKNRFTLRCGFEEAKYSGINSIRRRICYDEI